MLRLKVRTKLAVLLSLVLAFFVAGLAGLKAYERLRFERFVGARVAEQARVFDNFLAQWRQPLANFVHEYSALDSMLDGLNGDPKAWLETNLTDPLLTSYHAHAVWVYRADGTLAASRNLLYSTELAEAPVSVESLLQLPGYEERHFFAWTRLGLMELQASTLHRSGDSARAEPGRGFLVAGRLWSNADLHEMSLMIGNHLFVVKREEWSNPASSSAAAIRLQRQLPGWNGEAVGTLVLQSESQVVQMLYRSSERLFFGTILSVLGFFLFLLFALTRWLRRPLKALSEGLQRQDLAKLGQLQQKGDEFGDLARLIKDFFEQRQSLEREMADRRQAERSLYDSEERLRHSQKMEAVGRLAGGVAHDFNNLLTAIIGYSSIIEVRTREEATREDAALITRAGERAADLTRQLLAFSRKQILQPRVLELRELVGNIQKLLARVIGEKIELRFEPESNHTRVCADPAQLEQVVLNLGVNARDAMPRGGVLSMRLEERELTVPLVHATGALRPGVYAALIVADTGFGMDEETMSRIFEPFFTTKDVGKGTGLGLATAYGIVEQSGGAILVESAPGAGAKFTVLLPAVTDAITPGAPAFAAPTRKSEAATVLVIEDENIVNDLICTVLTHAGYETLCASNGLEGLQKAKDFPKRIDLLLSDVVMPQLTGPEVASELLQQRPNLKVLFVSGYSEADISEDQILSPGVNLLQKPFTPDQLLQRVQEVLEQTTPEHLNAEVTVDAH